MKNYISETIRKYIPENSLERKVFKVSLIGSFVLGLVLMVIFLGLYAYTLGTQFIVESFMAAKSTAVAIGYDSDVKPLIEAVLEIYDGLSEEQKQETGLNKYSMHFLPIHFRSDYNTVYQIIEQYEEDFQLNDIYIGIFDRQRDALIYVCDPYQKTTTDFDIGTWEYIEEREIEKFCRWNGQGRLYDISNTPGYGWMCTSAVPVYVDGNKYTGFVMCDVMLGDIIREVLAFGLQYLIGLIIATFLIGVLITRRLRRNFVEPINQIADAAKSYVEDHKNGVQKNDHFGSLEINTGDEIENLTKVMADMESGLNDYEKNITRITAERERISTELRLAARIQNDALPREFPAFPDRNEFDIYASMDPAKEIGGDFYDYIMVDEDHLAVLIADVSGKGIPASLFMMASKIVFADNAKMGRSPAEILEAANNTICHNNFENMFVTAWIGILEISSGKVTAANAGHEYPVLMNDSGQFEYLKDPHGFVLGALENRKYAEYEFTMKPGTKLFIYTDGLPEAENTEKEMFGSERILQVLNQMPEASPKAILEEMQKAADDFSGECEQFDDLTMLCLEYRGVQESKADELLLDADVKETERATDHVNAILEEMDCPMRTMTQIDIALDELFSNIARYAYDSEEGKVILRTEKLDDPKGIRITLIDSGIPFDPLKSEDPDITAAAEEREIGGLGIFLVKKTMDHLSYNYEDGRNILTVIKYF